jgi:hypothetical protein
VDIRGGFGGGSTRSRISAVTDDRPDNLQIDLRWINPQDCIYELAHTFVLSDLSDKTDSQGSIASGHSHEILKGRVVTALGNVLQTRITDPPIQKGLSKGLRRNKN